MNGDTEFAKRFAHWRAPSELGGSPPRPVRLTGNGIVLTVFTIAVLIGGILIGIKISNETAGQNQTARLLQDQGADTSGTIVRLWRGGGKDKSYRVTYQFESQGSVYHKDAGASRKVWENLTTGSSVRVRYLPSDPGISRPLDWEPPHAPAWLAIFVPAASSCAPLVIIFVMLRRQRALLEDGRAAPGVIHKATRTKGGKSIRYEFLLPGGSREKGSGLVKRGTADAGDVVTIIYDPEQPSRNAPYPFTLVRPDKS